MSTEKTREKLLNLPQVSTIEDQMLEIHQSNAFKAYQQATTHEAPTFVQLS